MNFSETLLTLHPIDQMVMILTFLIGGISLILYRSDNDPKTYEGKAIAIGRYPSIKVLLKIFFYATSALILWSIFSPETAPGLLYVNHDARLAGALIAAAGSALFVVAKLTLGQSYSPCFKTFAPKEIVTRGVYGWIRHPIYTANFLIFLGSFVISGSLVVLVMTVLLALIYRWTARKEEQVLSQVFPNYGSYQRQTGMFAPPLRRLTVVRTESGT